MRAGMLLAGPAQHAAGSNLQSKSCSMEQMVGYGQRAPTDPITQSPIYPSHESFGSWDDTFLSCNAIRHTRVPYTCMQAHKTTRPPINTPARLGPTCSEMLSSVSGIIGVASPSSFMVSSPEARLCRSAMAAWTPTICGGEGRDAAGQRMKRVQPAPVQQPLILINLSQCSHPLRYVARMVGAERQVAAPGLKLPAIQDVHMRASYAAGSFVQLRSAAQR